MDKTLSLTPHEHVTVIEHTPDRLVVEVVYDPGASRPPAHVHPDQDERFEILEGRVTVRMAGQDRTLEAGDVLAIPRGTPHTMANSGDGPARARWETAPAGRTLEWFEAVAAAQARRAGLRHAAIAAALARYRDVFRLSR